MQQLINMDISEIGNRWTVVLLTNLLIIHVSNSWKHRIVIETGSLSLLWLPPAVRIISKFNEYMFTLAFVLWDCSFLYWSLKPGWRLYHWGIRFTELHFHRRDSCPLKIKKILIGQSTMWPDDHWVLTSEIRIQKCDQYNLVTIMYGVFTNRQPYLKFSNSSY